MSGSQETATRPTKIDIPESLAVQLYREAGAEKFGLTPQAFAGVLQEVAAKYLPATAGPSEVSDFLTHLRVEELALARACALGNEICLGDFPDPLSREALQRGALHRAGGCECPRAGGFPLC